METADEHNHFYAIRNEILAAVSINVKPALLDKVPWVIREDESLERAEEQLVQSELGSLLVVGKDGNVVGAVTNRLKLRIKCGGGGGGGGKLPVPAPRDVSQCNKKCKDKCSGKGGVRSCWVGQNSQCFWFCNNEFKQDVTLGDMFD